MKVHLKLNNLSFELEGSTEKELFKQVCKIQEVFGESECGACKSKDVFLQVRTVDETDFYEVKCRNPKCLAAMSFGQHKKGGSLFPKRFKMDGDKKIWSKTKGWEKWEKPNGSNKSNGNGKKVEKKEKVVTTGKDDEEIPF